MGDKKVILTVLSKKNSIWLTKNIAKVYWCLTILILPKASNKNVTTDKIMLKTMAVQKLSMMKKSTNSLVKRMIKAFIISKKIPKLRMVTFMVNKTNIGFKKVFKVAITMATINAFINFGSAISTPEISQALIRIAKDETINCIKYIPIFFLFSFIYNSLEC